MTRILGRKFWALIRITITNELQSNRNGIACYPNSESNAQHIQVSDSD